MALHRLSQSRRDEEGRRCQGRDLAALERQLKKGDKTLVGNKGYRRFLTTPDDDHFVIDCAKAEEDAKFDGGFVLARTPISPGGRLRRRKRGASNLRARNYQMSKGVVLEV